FSKPFHHLTDSLFHRHSWFPSELFSKLRTIGLTTKYVARVSFNLVNGIIRIVSKGLNCYIQNVAYGVDFSGPDIISLAIRTLIMQCEHKGVNHVVYVYEVT